MANLETDRLQLSPVRPEDWEAYHTVLSAPEISEYTDLPRKPSEKRTKALVNWMVRAVQKSKGGGWMVRESPTGAVLGCIRLNSISRQASFAVVGYEYDKIYWGKGYATEALIAVTNHCHKNMRLYRLEAWTLAGNAASDRVLQKAGFRMEGTQRQKMILRGQRFDQRLFGRLAGDCLA